MQRHNVIQNLNLSRFCLGSSCHICLNHSFQYRWLPSESLIYLYVREKIKVSTFLALIVFSLNNLHDRDILG